MILAIAKYIKHRLSSVIVVSILPLLLSILPGGVKAGPKKPHRGVLSARAKGPEPAICLFCTMSGPSPVAGGSTATYTLNGTCSPGASSWSCSGCIVNSYTSGSASITFGNGSSATITARTPSTTLATLTVTVSVPPPLVGGTISDPSQAMYAGVPGAINASVASGGSCNGSYAYQWYSSTDNVNFSQISGATGQNYQPGSLSVTTYFKRSVVCSGVGTYTTNTATVTIYGALSVSATPASESINYNSSAGTLTAHPSGGSGSYNYQWYTYVSGNWSAISGATGSTYAPGNLTSSASYLVQISSSGQAVNSNSVSVTVYAAVSCWIGPGDETINYNSSPPLLTANPSGGNGGYTYQWYTNASGSYQAIGGATGSSYQPPVLTATTRYEVMVTSNGASYTTGPVTMTVLPQLVSGTISPGSATINYNTSPGQLSETGLSGGTGSYGYQWYSSTGGSWSPISGATGSTYTPGAFTVPTSFEVVSSSNGVSVTSAAVTFSLYPQLVAGVATPGSITVAPGSDPGFLLCSPPTGGGCNGSYSYQWQSSPDGNSWSAASGTGLSFDPGVLSSSDYYRLMVTCNGQVVYSNVVAVSVALLTSDMNYVRTRMIVRPGVTDTTTAAGLTDPRDVQQTTQYLDGLGRSVQTVSRQQTPLGNDRVIVQAYDPFGREAIHYLPFVTASKDGNYKPYGLAEQDSFNVLQFPGEQYYYGETGFEASPLNRELADYGAGMSWVGHGRGKGTSYLVNTAQDSVVIWNIAAAQGSIPTMAGFYPAGVLFKNVTTDENGNMTVVYKDKEGEMILKKVQFSPSTGTAHVGWLCTYYVYDNAYALRFVVSPRAVELINTGTSWTIPATVAAELCYRYEYDYRNRVIIKKNPGAGEQHMVFDVRDRVVMSQDSNLRASHQWAFNTYDGLNRLDSTGLITDPTNYNNLAYHTTLAMASPTYPNLSAYSTQLLTAKYYDNYNAISGVSGLPAAMTTGITGNGTNFYTSYGSYPAYAVQPAAYAIARGQVTGSLTNVLGTGQYLYKETFYDDRGRPVQQFSTNVTGGRDTVTTQYDFVGEPLRVLLGHAKATNGAQAHTVVTKTAYDAASRVSSVYKNIDGAAADQLIDSMQYNELGQLRSKLLGKDPATGVALDSMIYDFNVRGWVTGINQRYLSDSANHYFGMQLRYDRETSSAGSTGSSPLQFNSNITGQVWKSAGDQTPRSYDYYYDNANRLKRANFTQSANGGAWSAGVMNFTTYGSDISDPNNQNSIGYDANGNIQSMWQEGWTTQGSTNIDALTYTYNTNSNRLSQVYDAKNDTASTLGDFHYKISKAGPGSTVDYYYDGNGNITSDANKAIDTIVYNYMNLPQLVHMKGKGNILYTYDASGAKLTKQVVDSSAGVATTTLYLDGFEYQRRAPIASPSSGIDTMLFAGHEDGRARWAFHKYLSGDSAYSWEYDFAEKDHLGNTRVLLTQEKDTAQYVATMEAAYRAKEDALFYGIDSTCIPRPAGYPDDVSVTNPNDSVSRLNGNGPSVGPAIILKVMAGDKFDVGVQYYYASGTTSSAPPLSAQSLLYSLASGLATLSPAAGESFSSFSNTTASPLLPAMNASVSKQSDTGATKPQAYVNWVLLDNQFSYWSSGSMQVGAAGTQSNGQLQPPLALTGLPVGKSGYLYIYLSNSTPGWDVFFDNLSIKHYSGPLIEENHYYPFGLTMSAISDKAIKTQYATNKFRYNGKELQSQEFSDGSGLEEYDYGARLYDQQLGVWHNPDVAADKAADWSPYRYGFDAPVKFTDPNGKYEVDGHYWTVYLMSLMLGESNQMAYNIAYWAEAPDQLTYPSGDVEELTNSWANPWDQGPYHAITGGNNMDEIEASEQMVTEAQSTRALGLALHRLGDSYAHERVGNEGHMYSRPWGHLLPSLIGTNPDKIANRPGLYMNYVYGLANALGAKLGNSQLPDLFTFDYVANSQGTTDQNAAVFETEINIREGGKTFSVDGDQVGTVNAYVGASNKHFGRDVSVTAIYTDVDVYNKDANGNWVKTKSEKRTFVSIQ